MRKNDRGSTLYTFMLVFWGAVAAQVCIVAASSFLTTNAQMGITPVIDSVYAPILSVSRLALPRSSFFLGDFPVVFAIYTLGVLAYATAAGLAAIILSFALHGCRGTRN